MTAQHAAERARVVVVEMPSSSTITKLQRALNDHCTSCRICRSDKWGICPEADRMLDDLLAALQAPREESWH